MTHPAPVRAPLQRLLSLDVLRGLTIAFMILVNNNGGSGSWGFMNHAAWNGLTPTDLVFPTFLFVVGASIAFAFEARLARGATRRQLALHAVQRAAVLFLLGIVVNGFPFFELAHLRIYGVLQRIAICYLVVGLFYLWDRRVSTKLAAIAALLVAYWVLLRWVPVPSAGMPLRQVPFLDPDQNLTAWIDRQVFPHHLYEDAVTHNLRDPEGLLSNLPAIATALIGLLAGLWLRGQRAVRTKTAGLAVAALACLGSGYLWAIWFPLNKKLWTSSYVLVAAGWSLALLALLFWAIEQRKWRRGWTWPWLVLGSNAIVAYMISELAASPLWLLTVPQGGKRISLQSYLFLHCFQGIPDAGWAAFAFAVSYLVLCFVPVGVLYRKRIFVKI
jgi:predicted acyltransferase